MLREADGLRDEVNTWRALEKRADDLLELAQLAEADADDAEMAAELDSESQAVSAEYERLRTSLLFSGEYDADNAILTITAGAGGTEATDWAEMLLRMYLRWAQRHRYSNEILDQLEGEEAGLKSVTVGIGGRNAYGHLRA